MRFTPIDQDQPVEEYCFLCKEEAEARYNLLSEEEAEELITRSVTLLKEARDQWWNEEGRKPIFGLQSRKILPW